MLLPLSRAVGISGMAEGPAGVIPMAQVPHAEVNKNCDLCHEVLQDRARLGKIGGGESCQGQPGSDPIVLVLAAEARHSVNNKHARPL